MITFLTADLHFNHPAICGMSNRRFASVDEHDDYLISQINATVGRHDRLIIQGDVAWKNFASLRMRINCKHLWLIWGNHDKASFRPCFSRCEKTLEIKVGIKGTQHKLFMSHYPHAYWPASHHGSLHTYGHVHDQREETLDACFPGRRSTDVGVDTAKRLLGAYRPFSEFEIIDMLTKRPGHDDVQFYEDYRAQKLQERLNRAADSYVNQCNALNQALRSDT